jgi:archaellum biogenesis ATPase FlaH
MARSLTTRNLFDKRPDRVVSFQNELLQKAIGEAEAKGCWLIYGPEKNGKTWFSLQLAKELSRNENVSYISAEDGTDKSFIDACERAGISKNDRIMWDEYLTLEEIIEKFRKPRTANIIFIDNLTIYADEFKNMSFMDFKSSLPGKLIICIAHEERKEPYPAVARMAKKLSKVYVQVRGLKAFVTSRFSTGGELIINEEMSQLYWGE